MSLRKEGEGPGDGEPSSVFLILGYTIRTVLTGGGRGGEQEEAGEGSEGKENEAGERREGKKGGEAREGKEEGGGEGED